MELQDVLYIILNNGLPQCTPQNSIRLGIVDEYNMTSDELDSEILHEICFPLGGSRIT